MMGLFTKLLIANNSINCCKHRQAHNLPINGDYEPEFFMDFSLLYLSLMSKMNIDFFERFMIFLHTFLISVLKKQFATNCF